VLESVKQSVDERVELEGELEELVGDEVLLLKT
jgi:hypothetical protein